MTGLWQVSGRSELDFDELVRLDFLYLERWSVFLDLTIMLKTIPAVVRSAGRLVSEPYEPDNLLDRHSDPATLQVHYDQEYRRERALLERRLGRAAARCCRSAAAGTRAGTCSRARRWRMTGVDLNPAMLEVGRARRRRGGPRGRADLRARLLRRGALPARAAPHRLPGPARAGLRRGGAAAAPRRRAGGGRAGAVAPGRGGPGAGQPRRARHRVHGTPDDIPLSPRALVREARAAGLEPELHAVTFGWRRLPAPAQRALHALDPLGSRPRAGALRSHADADRAAVLHQRHAEAQARRTARRPRSSPRARRSAARAPGRPG